MAHLAANYNKGVCSLLFCCAVALPLVLWAHKCRRDLQRRWRFKGSWDHKAQSGRRLLAVVPERYFVLALEELKS